MPITVVDVLGAQYQTTRTADAKCSELLRRFGYKHRYFAARLAIARSLSLPEPPPKDDGEDDPATPIRGQQLFRDTADAAAWLAIVSEAAGTDELSLTDFKKMIARHWGRGATFLMQDWEDAKGDLGTFVTKLAELARLRAEGRTMGKGGAIDGAGRAREALAPTAVTVPIGDISEDLATGEQVLWRLNAPGGSPHAAIMGGVGSGKTRTAVGMLRAIRAVTPVPLIAFDFKGDMTDDRNKLDQVFEATVLSPPYQPIPLDVLHLSDRTPTAISLAAQRLRDGLATLKDGGFGAKQKGWLATAAENALRTHVPCTLAHLRDALRAVYAQNNQNPDGAVNTLEELCRLPLFEARLAPADFFSRSWIIRLTQDLPDLVRITVVTLLTDALDRHLNSLPDTATDSAGNRALRNLCVIDEAHRILGSKLPGLSGLVRLGRSKGGVVVLISQGPNDFDGVDDDFLNEMGLVLAFRTNAEARSVKRILGTAAKLARLETGQAWVKIAGEGDARRVLAWRDERSSSNSAGRGA